MFSLDRDSRELSHFQSQAASLHAASRKRREGASKTRNLAALDQKPELHDKTQPPILIPHQRAACKTKRRPCCCLTPVTSGFLFNPKETDTGLKRLTNWSALAQPRTQHKTNVLRRAAFCCLLPSRGEGLPPRKSWRPWTAALLPHGELDSDPVCGDSRSCVTSDAATHTVPVNCWCRNRRWTCRQSVIDGPC
jgi:hypothetical protein